MSTSSKLSLFLLPGRAWSSDSPLDLKSGVLGSNPSSCFRYFRAQLLGYSNEPTNWSPSVPPWPDYGQLTVLFSLFALPPKTSGSAIILSSLGRFYIIRENQINLVNCSKLLPTQGAPYSRATTGSFFFFAIWREGFWECQRVTKPMQVPQINLTECQVEPAVSSDFSSKITSFIPPLAKW